MLLIDRNRLLKDKPESSAAGIFCCALLFSCMVEVLFEFISYLSSGEIRSNPIGTPTTTWKIDESRIANLYKA